MKTPCTPKKDGEHKKNIIEIDKLLSFPQLMLKIHMMKNKPVLGSGRKISNDPNNALLSVLLGLSCSEYFISNLIYQEQ